MRIAGSDCDETAKELQYADKSGAWRAVDRALRRRTDRAHELHVLKRLEDIDAVLLRYSDSAFAGSLAAVDRCADAIDERSLLIELA